MAPKIKQILSYLNRRDIRFIPKKFKSVLITLLIIGAFFLAKANFAQTPTTTPVFNDNYLKNNLIKQKQDAIKKGNNQESWIYESLGSNVVTGIVALSGEIPDNVLRGEQTSWVPSGMIGQATKLVASTFDQPVSGIEYIAQVKDNFLGKPVYAQGIGYPGLAPFLPIWKTFRNVIYAIFSLVFVGMGIAIMLRIKISPQAVVTIQTAIPKLISSLVLVTFSYAIFGLLIDLSQFIQAFVIALLFQGTTPPTSLTTDLFNQNNPAIPPFFNKIREAITSLPILSYFKNDLTNLTQMDFLRSCWLISNFVPNLLIGIMGGILGIMVGAFFGPVGLVVGGVVIGPVIFILIIQIVVFVLVVKFFIGLIKCYFTLILKLIMGPLEIAMGALPNSKMGFSSWIMDVVANLAVFPISAIFIVLISLIMSQLNSFKFVWIPSLLSLAGIQVTLTNTLQIIIGFGALLLLPKLPAMIPEFIFQLKPSPWGKAIGETFAPIGNFGKSVGKGAINLGSKAAAEKIPAKYAGKTWAKVAQKAGETVQQLTHH